MFENLDLGFDVARLLLTVSRPDFELSAAGAAARFISPEN